MKVISASLKSLTLSGKSPDYVHVCDEISIAHSHESLQIQPFPSEYPNEMREFTRALTQSKLGKQLEKLRILYLFNL